VAATERRLAAIVAADVVGYVTFQLAEVTLPRKLFQKILELINTGRMATR